MHYFHTMAEAPITLYNGVRDVVGIQTTFAEFMNRKAYDFLTGDEKRALPCITVGGQFRRRKLAELIAPSGIVQLDIDAKDNAHVQDWREVVETLALESAPESFCAISASGRGAFALYFLPSLLHTFETEGADAYLQEHRWSTNELAQQLYYESGLIADSSCINRPNGLRFISADQDAIVRTRVQALSGSAGIVAA